MKFAISQIRKNAFQEPFVFEHVVDVSDLEKLDNNDIRQIDPVQVKGMCTLDKNEIIFSLTLTATMVLPCARTLIDVPFDLKVDVTEIFTTSNHLTSEDEENEVHLVTDEVIDLMPYIKENILLAIPFRVFSNEKMIDEGEGWSYFTEDDKQDNSEEQIDPRLKKLQVLLDKRNEE